MSIYQDIKDEILDLNSAFYSVLARAETLSVNGDDGFSQWKAISRGITEKIKGETLRVAVVGSIKSGKSTFVNSLLEGDFLKRGAGVVTSIVTRVRKGENPVAKLYFKSWDDINMEIQQAIAIFPGKSWKMDKSSFDLRREADRNILRQALSELDAGHLIRQGELNADIVLLSSYLKGFDRVADAVSSESRTQTYAGDDFHLHRDFSGNDSQAVYLRDIQLDVDATILNDHLEIADCQGSDSPNPHHLAMIQDYLLTTNLLIYVISSRTGLRRADIRFLSMIKKMGIMDNIIFVINCDFSEHDTLSGLERLVENVNESLVLICPDPEIFTFSSLYNLFLSTRKTLPSKDQARLSQWELDPSLIDFSREQTRLFDDALTLKLTRDRYSLLLNNHLGRIHLACGGLRHWVGIRQKLMGSDADRIETILSRLSEQQQKSQEMGAMIRTTLDGAVSRTQQKIRHDVDRFFDLSSGKLINSVVGFIRHYQVENAIAEEELASAGFTSALYSLFQQFKNSVDQFMTTSVNPDIVRFVRDTEHEIANTFDQIAKPFELMVRDAVVENNTALNDQGLTGVTTIADKWPHPNLASVKSMMGLTLPPANTVMHYSARIKSDALLHYGAYSLVRWFRKVLKKPDGSKHTEGIKALADGMRRVKRETERSIKSQFMDYREHIKFQYLFKFIDGYAHTIHETLVSHFASYQGALSHASAEVDNQSTSKQEMIETLNELWIEIERITRQINSLRDQLMQPGTEHIN